MIVKLTAEDLEQAVKEWAGRKVKLEKPMLVRATIHGVWTLLGEDACVSVEFFELPENVQSIKDKRRR